jgi:hypothetical protein
MFDAYFNPMRSIILIEIFYFVKHKYFYWTVMLLGYFVTNIKIEVLKYQNKIVKIKVTWE